METRNAIFREIHKNTWLKRLTADGKKVTVGGVKKSERSWVVFCVHDDTEALLEGYSEPKLAASHNPEWIVKLQLTQHISHALVPNEHEYEFVVTLNEEVIRFHAISWEIMQEWVDTLRTKLREMRILSPRENLYTKLPEIRAPLLPTRDPTSPLPATPPVPAAIVPGIERIVPSTSISVSNATTSNFQTDTTTATSNNISDIVVSPAVLLSTTTTATTTAATTTVSATATMALTLPSTSMSNTSSQNLINLLSDPISNYSVQVSESNPDDSNSDCSESHPVQRIVEKSSHSPPKLLRSVLHNRNEEVPSLAQTFTNNVLSDPNTCPSSSHSLFVRTNSIVVSSVENSIRVDVGINTRKELKNDIASSSEPTTPARHGTSAVAIPRPHATRSISLSESSPNRSAASIKSEAVLQNNITELDIHSIPETATNVTIIQVSNPLQASSVPEVFKFPTPGDATTTSSQEEYKSNVQIIPSTLNLVPTTTCVNNQYSSPKKLPKTKPAVADSNKVTTVHVTGNSTSNCYGKLCPSVSNSNGNKGLKKVILSTNTSGITNISVGNDINSLSSSHYEKVFLSSSLPVSVASTSQAASINQQRASPKQPARSLIPKLTSHNKHQSNPIRIKNNNMPLQSNSNSSNECPVVLSANTTEQRKSPAPARIRTHRFDAGSENTPPITNRPMLTRGLTEAVITARPSRIDTRKPTTTREPKNNPGSQNIVERTRSESLEHRRRSSSTSDAQATRGGNRQINGTRSQQQQQSNQPFRLAQENGIGHASKRLTLREQQVLHLRREIMHPGGVRLQLRKKDCTGSIAWVDAFGAVWVAGWKQKDHPMLYNALHIGDQLISIAGSPINTATDANKIIRNTNTLFLEILIRRVPFGRVYAIRRELEGQCLGLIRDGNTATIVDVVPNSLAARHGLPPKAQSCDGLSLTFWVLTEVNGRPLNLFFKENEVRDRLNSVGRDISILVQPLDLIMKLKKQLKSLRSHKDYIVQ